MLTEVNLGRVVPPCQALHLVPISAFTSESPSLTLHLVSCTQGKHPPCFDLMPFLIKLLLKVWSYEQRSLLTAILCIYIVLPQAQATLPVRELYTCHVPTPQILPTAMAPHWFCVYCTPLGPQQAP